MVTDERGAPDVPSRIRLEAFAIPAVLQPFVTTLFTMHSDEPRFSDVLPAAVGYLLFAFEGKGAFHFGMGRRDSIYRATLLTPTSTATGLEVEGPWRVFGAELSTMGWAALTGLHAGEHIDRAYDAAEVLGADVAMLGERLCGSSDEDLAAELAEFVLPRLRPIHPRHVALIAQVTQWLYSSFDPQPADLRRESGYSPRQLQRLVERYFGTGPKQLARKYRALRVAGLLVSQESGEEQTAELLNLFYDQSHMIREMRRFVGRTPMKFGKDRSPMLVAATALRSHRELRPDRLWIRDD